MTIHCENGMCGICDDCREDSPISHPLTAEQRVAVLERALAESETSRRRYEETIAWQARQLDEALARAERAEENWKRCQEEAEKLGRALADDQGKYLRCVSEVIDDAIAEDRGLRKTTRPVGVP